MDERSPRRAAIPRALSTARAGGPSRLLRLARSHSARGPGRAGPGSRYRRLLLLLLLVQRQAPARAPARRHARQRSTGFPVLHLLGERKLDAPVGRTRTGGPPRAA